MYLNRFNLVTQAEISGNIGNIRISKFPKTDTTDKKYLGTVAHVLSVEIGVSAVWQPEAIDKSRLEDAERARRTPLVPFLDWIMGKTGTEVNPTALGSQS